MKRGKEKAYDYFLKWLEVISQCAGIISMIIQAVDFMGL